jgi:hypothetical protein
MTYNLQCKVDYEQIIVAYVERCIPDLIVGNKLRVLLEYFNGSSSPFRTQASYSVP